MNSDIEIAIDLQTKLSRYRLSIRSQTQSLSIKHPQPKLSRYRLSIRSQNSIVID
jgi:hypothetical protein